MEFIIGLLWSSAFSVIVLFLGALNYFLGRSQLDSKVSENKSQLETTNRTTTNNNRRKHARNANRKQRQLAAATTTIDVHLNSDNDSRDKQQTDSVSTENNNKEEELLIESSVQLTDEEQEFEDPMEIEEVFTPSHVEDEQKPILPVKQRHKNKSNSTYSSKEESILPSKPKASVAPVKQSHLLTPTINIQSTQIPQDNHSKSNENTSSCHIYSYSGRNSLPPRFQQRKEGNNGQRFRKRKTADQSKTPSNLSLSPLISKQQQPNNNNQLESSLQPSDHNGYSSESDVLTESSSTAPPLSNESQVSFQRSDLSRSLSASNLFLDKLVSVFDQTSFSSDELELILNKITTKHVLNKQEWSRLSSSSTIKNEKTIERLLDETYRSQAKILAIELQTEKNRILELTKMNADMDNTIRQLQQPNNNLIPYQQTILHYQMQIRRITDDNARLVHQLHAYSIMPASINELKQQQHILSEQLRQITMRNNNLEQEIADGERASKHAAEIYQKADNQKQERIEQMINDINKYKKIDRDLSTLQIKHTELEKNLNSKLDDLTQQRDDLQKSYDQLNEQVQQYEQLKIQYEQFLQNSSSTNELQQELDEVKTKNDILRQRNWKIMEQLNKLLSEQK